MKYLSVLLVLCMMGCSATKPHKDNAETASSVSSKPQVLLPVGSVLMMSVEHSFAYDAKEICIDTTDDGHLLVTFTEVSTGNRCTVAGGAKLLNLKDGDWQMRDLRKNK